MPIHVSSLPVHSDNITSTQQYLGPVATVVDELGQISGTDIEEASSQISMGKQPSFFAAGSGWSCAMRGSHQVVEFYLNFECCEVRVHLGESYTNCSRTLEIMLEGEEGIINAIRKWIAVGNITRLSDICCLPPKFALLGELHIEHARFEQGRDMHRLHIPTRRWMAAQTQ